MYTKNRNTLNILTHLSRSTEGNAAEQKWYISACCNMQHKAGGNRLSYCVGVDKNKHNMGPK